MLLIYHQLYATAFFNIVPAAIAILKFIIVVVYVLFFL